MTDLHTLGGDNSRGVAINDSGEVAGFSQIKTGVFGPRPCAGRPR